MTTTSEQRATQEDVTQKLSELLEQHARIANAARFDSELRAEVESIDAEIKATKRVLGRYCPECGNRLLLVNGAETCCWSPCSLNGKPVHHEETRR
jgi:hypothetical protein